MRWRHCSTWNSPSKPTPQRTLTPTNRHPHATAAPCEHQDWRAPRPTIHSPKPPPREENTAHAGPRDNPPVELGDQSTAGRQYAILCVAFSWRNVYGAGLRSRGNALPHGSRLAIVLTCKEKAAGKARGTSEDSESRYEKTKWGSWPLPARPLTYWANHIVLSRRAPCRLRQ